MYIDKNKFGGYTSQEEIKNIMLNNAKTYNLNYSHKKENRWNLWMTDSGTTLSFVLNNGLFIPSISGLTKKTLEKFYSTCPSDVDGWVRASIKEYFKETKRVLLDIDNQREIEAFEAYMRRYYADMAAIDRDNETEAQKYNRENDEFLTEEEYAQAYQQEAQQLVEDTQQLVLKLKPVKRSKKDQPIPGQLSLIDMKEVKKWKVKVINIL